MTKPNLRQIKTRIPETLRRRLARSASANYHSMNAEIIERLEASFRESEQVRMIRRLDALARDLNREFMPLLRAAMHCWAINVDGKTEEEITIALQTPDRAK